MLLLAAGALPSTALFLMPIILPLLYLLFRRFGAVFPLSCVLFYGVFSLVFNYDVLTVVYAVFLFFALIGVVLSAQLKPYLLCMTVAAVFAVFGAFAGMGIVRLAEGKPLGDVGKEYVMRQSDDPFVDYLARDYYENANIPEDIGRVKPNEKGYDKAVVELFGEYVKDELDGYAPYDCVHFGGLIALIAYFISIAINRRTASAYDCDISAEEVALGTRCLGGVRVENTPIANMRFPRSFLWSVLLPALTASVLLDIIGGYAALSATFMHAFITLPTAAAFVGLAAYFVSLTKGKGRVVAYILFFALMIAAVIIPIVLLISSILGLCDIILDLRFWTDFIRTEG